MTRAFASGARTIEVRDDGKGILTLRLPMQPLSVDRFRVTPPTT